jgi:hypothetical protein
MRANSADQAVRRTWRTVRRGDRVGPRWNRLMPTVAVVISFENSSNEAAVAAGWGDIWASRRLLAWRTTPSASKTA